jgi:hypothetical protein
MEFFKAQIRSPASITLLAVGGLQTTILWLLYRFNAISLKIPKGFL